MLKKLLKISSLILVGLNPMLILACSSQKESEHVFNSQLFGKDYFKTKSIAKMDASQIEYKDLTSIPENLNAHYGYKIIAGGFGELRKYYKKPIDKSWKDNKSWHLGQDIILPPGTAIYAPYDGEIINSIWKGQDVKQTHAYGIGGNLTLKVKISELNIKPQLKEFIYLKYYKEHKNIYWPDGKRIELFYYPVPKIQFSKNGKYIAPTNETLKGYNNAKITISTKEKYENWINDYTKKDSYNTNKKKITTLINKDFLNFVKKSKNYIYISMMHLAKKSIDIWGKGAIWPRSNPQIYYSPKINFKRKLVKVKKGDIIGYVGDKNENGGWISHVHIEIFTISHNPGAYFNAQNIWKWEKNSKYKRWNVVKGKGTTHSLKGKKDINATQNMFKTHYGTFSNFAQSRNIIDANEIFKFYNLKSKIIKMKTTI